MRLSQFEATAAPLLFVLLWSTGFIGARLGLPHAEPMTFLGIRMIVAVIIMAVIALAVGARWPHPRELGHSLIAGTLMHGIYLGGVFVAISQGVPAGISSLIPGLQPILTAVIANRLMGEHVTRIQWAGIGLGLIGVFIVLHDRSTQISGSGVGWIASFVSLFGITFGTFYQKRYCTAIDWRTGNTVQYIGAGILFWLGSLLFETRVVDWSGELIFAIAWLVFVLSIAAVALMYWLIRNSAATKFSSLFYLVPAVTAIFAYILFGERLDAVSIAGMGVCAIGVVLTSKAGGLKPVSKIAATHKI